MADKKVSIDSNAIGMEIGEKIKNAVTKGKDLQEISTMVLNVLSKHGIELPEKAKQAILEYQHKK